VDVPDAIEAPARSSPRTEPGRPSLATQFLLANLVVLLLGMLVTGAWVGAQIEAGVLDHAAATEAFFVDSVISPGLQRLATQSTLDEADVAHLDWLLDATLRGRRVVAVKVWLPDGHIVYSRNSAQIGRQYPVDGDLSAALRGEVNASISNLQDEENEFERQEYSRLMQVYAPVRRSSDGRIIAVTEFYQPPDELDADITAARGRSWLIVGLVAVAAYVLLAGIVKSGSDTIIRQAQLLRRQFAELSLLHERARQAAARTTALNERALRRISADLHDGPGQTLALALLRLDGLRVPPNCADCAPMARDHDVIVGALRDALADVRTITANLRTPELEQMRPIDVAERVVTTHQRRTGAHVELIASNLPEHAPLAIKIAVLRTLQEALSNATRHGGPGTSIGVRLRTVGDTLHMTVTDDGQGFTLEDAQRSGGMGLSVMRERAELLGGSMDVQSAPGEGTIVVTCSPLTTPESHG
jgi:signal transduction histidine kinase